jgi:uncharacterized protein YeaO (DUF488 family)
MVQSPLTARPVHRRKEEKSPKEEATDVAHPLGVKRIYDPAEEADGVRVLVDRLWPRGVTKQHAGVDLWLRDIAPSSGLRRWFAHDPARWSQFCERYTAELQVNAADVSRLRHLIADGPVTLLYGARDTQHNHAKALARYLELA